MLFSKRKKIASEVDKWLQKRQIPPHTVNILAALSALGYRVTTKEVTEHDGSNH